jgi:hypothetical protein
VQIDWAIGLLVFTLFIPLILQSFANIVKQNIAGPLNRTMQRPKDHKQSKLKFPEPIQRNLVIKPDWWEA